MRKKYWQFMTGALMICSLAAFAGCARTLEETGGSTGQMQVEASSQSPADSFSGKGDRGDKENGIPADSINEDAFDITADELLEYGLGDQKLESAEVEYLQIIECETDAAGKVNTGGSDTIIATSTINVNMKITSTNSSCIGVHDVNILGMLIHQDTKAYETTENGISQLYTYDQDTDSWSVEDVTDTYDQERMDWSDLLNPDAYENYWLADLDQSGDYVVEAIGGVTDIFVPFSVVSNYEDMMFNVRMTFDRETKRVKTVEYTLGQENYAVDDVLIKSLSHQYTFHQFGGVEVEIPQEVIDQAQPVL